MDRTFFALSHPTRRALLERLAGGDLTIGEAAEGLGDSPSQITKHVRILEAAGLVARRREGRTHRLRFNAGPIDEALGWLGRQRAFWDGRLDALADYLDGQDRRDG